MEGFSKLNGKKILLGVSGSIAAYKAIDVLRRMQDHGAVVRVVMTRNASRFVSPLTFETLSGNPVPSADFQEREQSGIGHIEMTEGLDAALIAPATANVIGKIASGIADDTLTTTLLALNCPLILAPAMNDRMYRNLVVQKNIYFLKQQGVRFVEPGVGQLACGTAGQGRLADLDAILREVISALPTGDLAGLRILVTAGPTREQIDPVRFISNPSTGKMGFALAAAAKARGAEVVLVSGPTTIKPPQGITVTNVISAAEMSRAAMNEAVRTDIVIMAAAVSDFRPKAAFERKIKKEEAASVIELERTEDILTAMSRLPGKRMIVGFAAETHDIEENARKKLKSKNLDLIVANDLSQQGAGFGTDTNSVIMIERSGARNQIPTTTKAEVADRILDKIVELRKT